MIQVYDADNPNTGNSWRVTKTINPSEYDWEDYTLPENPTRAKSREQKGVWVRFEFQDQIPVEGMTSEQFLVGVQLKNSNLLGSGYSKFNQECGKNWTLNQRSNIGWELNSSGNSCNWPMLKIHIEKRSINDCP